MKRLRGLFYVIFVFAITILFFMSGFANENMSSKVGAQLSEIDARLYAIARYTGVTPVTSRLYSISGANDHEVYFETTRLYQKVAQLNFEITGDNLSQIKKGKSGKVQADDIYVVLSKTNNVLKNIMSKLGITTPITAEKRVVTQTPSILFGRLLLSNQLANQLIERKTQPADVYRNITLGIYYAGEILQTMPGQVILPEKPAFVPNKKPYDVYRLLIQVLTEVKALAKSLQIKMITIQEINIDDKIITPNDVEELSLIIVAELEYIAKKKRIPIAHIESYYPGKKYPSNVYQRSLLLKEQINTIREYIKKNPNWLYEHRHD